jgi:hypothetical protein
MRNGSLDANPAGIDTAELRRQMAEMISVGTRAAAPDRLLDIFHVQRHERAHWPFGTGGNVKRASDHVKEAIHRNSGDKNRHQNRVQPPRREMHCLGGAYADTAQQCKIDQPADGRPVRDVRLHLGVMHAQSFHSETGDA